MDNERNIFDMHDVAYLRNLRDRLMAVPAQYGVDQGDCDRIDAIINPDPVVSLHPLGEPAPTGWGWDPDDLDSTELFALLLAEHGVRNSALEDIHARSFGDADMRVLMREVVNGIYTILKHGAAPMMSSSRRWDRPVDLVAAGVWPDEILCRAPEDS